MIELVVLLPPQVQFNMASSRMGSRRHEILGEPIQSKRPGAHTEMSSVDFPSSLSRRARKAAESARLAPADIQQPRSTSKIPQTSSRQAPSQSYAWKQTLARDNRPANSSSSNISEKTSTSTPSYSTAPSSRSQDSSRQTRNVLRRKQPALNQEPARSQYHAPNTSMRNDSTSSVARPQPLSLDTSKDSQADRNLTNSPAEIQVAQRVELPTTNAQAVTIYPELDRYRDFKPQSSSTNHYFEVPYPISTDLPPPTPLFSAASSQHSAFSGSPSTRFSESPGPGPYSRDTTPTSMSSQSPGFSAPMRVPLPRAKQSSPAAMRPPVTRRRAASASNETQEAGMEQEGLAAMRESSNSSSSNSTVRASAVRDQQTKKRMELVTPIPPTRKSSEKFVRTRDNHMVASKAVREPAKPTTMAPSASKVDSVARPTRDMSNAPPSRAAPARPSREGTTDLHSQIGLPVPIVHSNLSTTSLSERRRSNQNLPSTISRTTTPLQSEHSRQASISRVGREPTPAPDTSAPVPDPKAAKQIQRGAMRTPSPSVSSTLKSRFPLFSRRNKTAPDAPSVVTDKKEKPPRKGPAAGTGHEGYGRLGHVRRRSGTLTGALRAMPGTMSSQESLASNQPSDQFLAQRMSPVIIAGGTVIENRNASSDLSRTESNQSVAVTRPSLVGSRNNSEVSLSSQEARNTLWPSALPRGTQTTPPLGHRRLPSDSSDSDVLTMRSTLAFRRSIQRLQTPEQANVRLPKPITVRSGAATPAINSQDTTLMSDDSTFSTRQPMGIGRTGSPAGKKLTKKPKSPRRWNFFGRSTSQPADKKKQPDVPPLSAAVKVVQQKPVAFYTMMDPAEQEDDGFADVEDVLREAQISSRPSSIIQAPSSTGRRPSISRNQSQESTSATARPKKSEMVQAPRGIPTAVPSRGSGNPPSGATREPKLATASKPPSTWRNRPTRLPHVGRIPQVNTRPDPTPPSPMSFSRPFNRSSLQLQSPSDHELPADEFVAKGPSPEEPPSPTREPTRGGPETYTDMERDPVLSTQVSRELQSATADSQKEFFTFPPRKNSEGTSIAESSSCSGLMSYSDATAVIPDLNAPLVEDEVWDEYNDLLGDDVPRGHPSASSSLGRPFHLEMWGRQLAAESDQPMVSPTITANMPAQMDEILDSVESECETEFEAEPMVELMAEPVVESAIEPAPTSSSIYSADMTAKINEILEAAGAERSPFSVNEFISGYGSHSNSVEASRTQSQRVSTSSSQMARVVRESHNSSSSQGSDDYSAVSQVNLRVGSMQVSKWLTFGHVLFSPVRDELLPMAGSLNRHSILVIDGLGNDDWSFYVAETYPAATFFNLSPRMPLSAGQQSPHSSFPLSPPNHHQIQYKSYLEKLPFGPQSFTCVVYRFPAAAPESHYRNIINEARRVLKPGGYIELSILDVDMNNMGNHARRAVRRLKERIHIRSPEINLASSSDLILRLLGRKGFTDIKTCRVGVPLASAVSSSATGGPESSSSLRSGIASAAGGGSSSTRRRGKRETRGLAEMMNTEGPGADESITKMVAKVGRWWYDRCYESVALESGGKSMWTDRSLLAECEEWNTSLKLMVCHARIPDGRSRVASI